LSYYCLVVNFISFIYASFVTDINECSQTHKPCNHTFLNNLQNLDWWLLNRILTFDKTNCKGTCRQNFLRCNYLYEHDVKMYNYSSMYLMMGAKQNVYYNDSATSKTLLTLSFCQGSNSCFNKQSF